MLKVYLELPGVHIKPTGESAKNGFVAGIGLKETCTNKDLGQKWDIWDSKTK